jgi:hypothetical protein
MSNLGIGTIAEGSDESSEVSSVPSDDDFGSDSDLQSSASSDAPDSDSEGMPSDSEDDDAPDASSEDDAPSDSDNPSSVDISSDEDSEKLSAAAAPAPLPPKKGTGKSLAGRLKGKGGGKSKKSSSSKGNAASSKSKTPADSVASQLDAELSDLSSLGLGLGAVAAASEKAKAKEPASANNDPTPTIVVPPRTKAPGATANAKPTLKAAVPRQTSTGPGGKGTRKLSFQDERDGAPRGGAAVAPSSSGSNTLFSSSTVGYKQVKARYEDDPFETVGVKVNAATFTLSVFITVMDEDLPVFATYELGESSMATDPSDPNRLYFRTLDALITFEAQFPVDIQALVRQLPEGIITHDTKYVTSDSLNQAPKGRPNVNLLGTSRDREFAPPGGGPGGDQDGDMNEGIKGYSRLELLESHIRKPQLSVRRVRQICHWINSMKLWKQTVDIASLHGCMCNGVLLARIVQKVVPGTSFLHLNEKALSRRAALDNLEKSLGTIWRSKCVNNSRIPSATDIYDGNMHKMATMLQEIFEVYVQRPLIKQAIKVLKWYNNILKQYDRRLPIGIFTESDFEAVWSHFQSGSALFCVIYHLFGPITVGSGRNLVKIDPIRIVNNPANLSEYRTNLMYTFSLLHALEIDVLWDVMDFLSYPDVDFVLLQLTVIYDKLKSRQCSLPPAQGMNAGVTSGPQGLMVVGMVFSDTTVTPKNEHMSGTDRAAAMKRNRSVLLGAGSESLKVLPVDSAQTGRFQSASLPAGLLAADSTIDRVTINIKSKRAASQRSAWLSTSDKSDDPINVFNSTQVAVLKKVNQTRGDAEETKATANRMLPPANESGIDAAIAALELNTTANRDALDEKEDELAERYGDLETRVQMGLLSADAYEVAFMSLEKQRLGLEDDRAKSEEIYQLRLESIRAQREEAKLRENAEVEFNKKTAAAVGSPTRTTSRGRGGPNSPSKNKAGGNSSKGYSKRAITSEQKEKLEHSWIPFHGRVKESLNSKIKRLADLAVDQQTTLMEKSQFNKSSTFRPESSASLTQNHEQIWVSFKRKLAERTRAFYDDKEEKTARLDNILSPIRKAAASSKVPVVVSVATRRTSFLTSGGDSSEYPRLQEIAMMAEEEDYRRRYTRATYVEKATVAEKAAHDAAAADELLANASTAMVFSKNAVAQDPMGGTLDHTGVMREIDVCLRVLQQQRMLGMWDRNVRRDYTWYVEKALVAHSGSQSSNRSGEMAEYRLTWVDNVGRDRSRGYVSIEDIVSLDTEEKGSETLLVMELGESPHMLMSTGGRTELYIGFSSAADCEVFSKTLLRLYESVVAYKNFPTI